MILSVAIVAGHGFMIFGYECVESMERRGTSIWRVWTLAKVQALIEHKQGWGRTMGPVDDI
jgi:hypothetical protein